MLHRGWKSSKVQVGWCHSPAQTFNNITVCTELMATAELGYSSLACQDPSLLFKLYLLLISCIWPSCSVLIEDRDHIFHFCLKQHLACSVLSLPSVNLCQVELDSSGQGLPIFSAQFIQLLMEAVLYRALLVCPDLCWVLYIHYLFKSL